MKKLKEFRNSRRDALQILRDLRDSQKRQKIHPVLSLPDSNDPQAILHYHCTGAPKLRQLMALVAEIVVLMGEKVTIWINTPAQMQWLCSVR